MIPHQDEDDFYHDGPADDAPHQKQVRRWPGFTAFLITLAVICLGIIIYASI